MCIFCQEEQSSRFVNVKGLPLALLPDCFNPLCQFDTRSCCS